MKQSPNSKTKHKTWKQLIALLTVLTIAPPHNQSVIPSFKLTPLSSTSTADNKLPNDCFYKPKVKKYIFGVSRQTKIFRIMDESGTQLSTIDSLQNFFRKLLNIPGTTKFYGTHKDGIIGKYDVSDPNYQISIQTSRLSTNSQGKIMAISPATEPGSFYLITSADSAVTKEDLTNIVPNPPSIRLTPSNFAIYGLKNSKSLLFSAFLWRIKKALCR